MLGVSCCYVMHDNIPYYYVTTGRNVVMSLEGSCLLTFDEAPASVFMLCKTYLHKPHNFNNDN